MLDRFGKKKNKPSVSLSLASSPTRGAFGMAVNSVKVKAIIASGVRWKAVTRPVTAVPTSRPSPQARRVLEIPSPSRTSPSGFMPVSPPPAAKAGEGRSYQPEVSKKEP